MPSRVAPRLPIVRFLEERSRTQRLLGLSVVAMYLVWQSLRGVSRILLDRYWLDTVTDAPQCLQHRGGRSLGWGGTNRSTRCSSLMSRLQLAWRKP